MTTGLAKFNLKMNVVSTVIAFVLNLFLLFLSYRLIILQSGIEAVGLWSTLFAWTTLIRLGDVGMTSASLRFVALCDLGTEKARIRTYIETGIIANTVLFSILGTFGYYLLSANAENLVETQHVAEAKNVLPIMMFAFVLLNINGVLQGVLQGVHLGYVGAQAGVGGSVLQIILVAILVPKLGIEGLAWAQIVQYGLMAIGMWVFIRHKVYISSPLPMQFSRAAFKEMLGFSIKSQLSNILNGLFEPLSKILVGQYGGLQTLGVYELAYKSLWLPRNAIIAGVTALMPSLTSLVKQNPEQAKPLYQKSNHYALSLVTLTSALVLICSPMISMLWMGEFKEEYSLFIAILSIGVIANSWGASAYNLGSITGTMKFNIAVNAATLILCVVTITLMATLQPSGVYMIAAIAGSIAFGGIAIKFANESLLQTKREKE